MKRTLVLLLAAALVIGALSLPALAETTDEAANAVSSATVQDQQAAGNTASRGHGNRQKPGQGGQQMPGQNGQQMPGQGRQQKPGRNGQQMPGQNGQQMPGQNGQQVPGQNGQQVPGQDGQQVPGQDGQQVPGQENGSTTQGKGFGGQHNGRHGARLDLDRLLKENVITQEVYDTVTEYMKKNAPQPDTANAPAENAPAEGSEPPAAPAEGSEPPAAPEGAGEAPESPELRMLNELLESGAITQEQYDLLVSKLEAPADADNT